MSTPPNPNPPPLRRSRGRGSCCRGAGPSGLVLPHVCGGFRLVLVLGVGFLLWACSGAGPRAVTKGAEWHAGAVAYAHPASTAIGLEVLRSGGNAVDAAVAVGLAQGVVDPFNSGIGGGGFILIREADGTAHAVDAREKAPRAAGRDLYIRDGAYVPALSRVGGLAVAVPGMLAGYAKALEIAGTRSLGELIRPSIALAEEGFPLDAYYLARCRSALDALRRDPASAALCLAEDGAPRLEGDILRRPDLARTYREIAAGGLDYFYRGAFARRLAAYLEQQGGLITLEDMEAYEAVLRPPVVGTYRGATLLGMPPPSSGGVHVLQILNMLEASGILDGGAGWTPDSLFQASRFMARAFEDRAVYLGDPDFHPVPVRRLTSKAYAGALVCSLRARSPAGGTMDPAPFPPAQGHTTNLAVVDRWGNAVAVNQTVNLAFGAKITLPGTGVVLNNEMDDFSAQPGKPNAFGLVGSEANAIAPDKRPLSSMAPTIVVRDGRPVLVLGGAGGPAIITAVVQVTVAVLDFGLPLAEALALPRFHHQHVPDLLMIEPAMPASLREAQERRGTKVLVRERLGIVNAVWWDDTRKSYVGLPDPRMGDRSAKPRREGKAPDA